MFYSIVYKSYQNIDKRNNRDNKKKVMNKSTPFLLLFLFFLLKYKTEK